MSSDNRSRGVSLSTVLVVIFIVLKLTGGIDWSWWWVFSPWLITIGLAALICLFLVLLAGGSDRGNP